MKNNSFFIHFSLLLILLSTVGYGQTLHLLQGDSLDVTNTVVTIPVTKKEVTWVGFFLSNKSAVPISYMVNRTVLSPKTLNPCTMLACSVDINCYAPNSLIFWKPEFDEKFTIGPNEVIPSETNNKWGLQTHYLACENECQDVTVLYKVYNIDSTNDTARLTINYVCTTKTGVEETGTRSAALSAVYPNPTHANFTIPYQFANPVKGELIIYDLIGNKVKEVVLEQKQGMVSFDASQFAPGIYFYSLRVNNQLISTKKLIIE